MANENVTGPAFLYVSIPKRTMTNSATGLPAALAYPTSGDIRFLGTSQQPPRIGFNVNYDPVMNDNTGTIVPMDYQYQGQSVQLAYTLNYWNEAVLIELDRVGQFAGTVRGKDNFGDIGSLMIFEGMTFHVWVQFPYATSKAFGSAYNMPLGYHFSAARLLNYQLDIGTQFEKRLFPIEAWPVYNPTDGSRLTWDTTFTNIPAPPSMPPIAASGALS